MHFLRINGNIKMIMNHRQNSDNDEALIFQDLTPVQQDRYWDLTGQGFSEYQIFEQLMSEIAAAKTERSAMTKQQLTDLLESHFGKSLPTLTRMNKQDLTLICESLELEH